MPEEEKSCYLCRRHLIDVEKEIGQRSELLKIETIYGDVEICELCYEIIITIASKEIKEGIEKEIENIEEIVKGILGEQLMLTGKVLIGEMKVEKKAEPLRIEKMVEEEMSLDEEEGGSQKEGEEKDEEEKDEGEDEDNEK
jgi:hypothetical protein